MTGRLGSCAAACTVTLIAVSSTVGIMNPRTTQEGCGGMAIVTVQCGCKVGGVGLGRLANRGRTIMTGGTVINDADMINYRAGEANREPGGMADAAILAGWYMVT